jgi:hypothetical protein
LLILLRTIRLLAVAMLCTAAVPLFAASPSQSLTDAAFQTRDKTQALALIAVADRDAATLVAANPRNDEAILVRAMALGYRAKLNRSRGEAMAAREQFEHLAATDPRDADAAVCVGTWHLDSIVDLGGFLAGMTIGAKKATGFAMTDRAVALGGNRAMYSGIAALLRLSIDPSDPRGRALAQQASTGVVLRPLDRIFQRSALTILVSLRAGDGDATRKLARQLLPFGHLAR